MEQFTTFDIIKKFKITRSSLQQWIDRGFITPSIGQAKGQGTKNIFSRNDLYRLLTFIALSKSGLSQRDASPDSNINFQIAKSKPYCVMEKVWYDKFTLRSIHFEKTLSPDKVLSQSDKGLSFAIVFDLRKVVAEVDAMFPK